MAVASAGKVFIEQDDELTLVLERIKEAQKERVVVVVPVGSPIGSSIVSIKVLAKQILKSNKLIVLITDDQFTRKLAVRAGLIVVDKMSNVTAAIWEKAQLNKERDAALLKKHEQKLLSDSKPKDIEVEDKVEQVIEESLEPEVIAEELIEAETIQPEVPVIPAKKRLDPKLVNVDGIDLMIGGDIDTVEDKDNYDVAEEETEIFEAEEIAIRPEFLGEDWTNRTQAVEKQNTSTSSRKIKLPKINFSSRYLYIAFAIIPLLVLALYVVVVNATAVITIDLKDAELEISETITVDKSVSAINIPNLILPGTVLTSEEISRSASATASGRAQTGNKSTGVIDLYNNTTSQVKVKSGTKVKSIANNLVYLIKGEFTLEAKTSGSPGLLRDVPVEAEKFGGEYNIEGSASNTQFKIGDYDTVNVVGMRIRAFLGGDSREAQVVSQQDIDKLRNQLEPQIREATLADINDLVPQEMKLIDGSSVYQETKLEVTPKLGEEATTFDLNLYGKTTAVVVKEGDLQDLIKQLATQGVDETLEVIDTSGLKFSNVKRTDSKTTFNLDTSSKLRSNVDTNELIEELRGKNIGEARWILGGKTGITSANISYSASFLPEFLQMLPTDSNKIRIKLQD